MNNSNNLNGINEIKIDKMVLDLRNYVEKINRTLNQISEVVDDTKNYFLSQSGNLYRTKYDLLEANYSTIKNNLLSYSDDLLKVKFRYQSMSENNKNIIYGRIQNVESNRRW